MIHKLNEQVLDTAQEEGADVNARKERRLNGSPSIQGCGQSSPLDDKEGAASPAFSAHSNISGTSAAQVSNLRSLVEENSINKSSKEGLARVQESDVRASAEAAEALAGMTTAASSSTVGNSKKRTLLAATQAASLKRAKKE
jgi:hypothetical protein